MEDWRPGVLNKEQVIRLCELGHVKAADPDKFESPASIDLHITDDVYRLKGSFKPKPDLDIPALLNAYKEENLSFQNGVISLEKGKAYIFRVKEHLDLKDTPICALATGRSTFGRLDILTRLLTSNSDSYDEVRKDYTGSLWVEVIPITLPIKIKKDEAFNQLRFFKGDLPVSRIRKEDLPLWGNLILDEEGNPIEPHHNLTLNLHEDPKLEKEICAYVAKTSEKGKEVPELDLTIDLQQGCHSISDYWETLPPTMKEPLSLEIEPEKFYILRSCERFKLPKSVAIYCQAISETLGELRIHYAGFVHPRFSENRRDGKGAPLIFEVRGHNIKTYLQHGETLARLEYYSMSADAGEYECPYSDQELMLSKYFE